VKLRTVFLTTAAFALAVACTPAAETPATDAPAPSDIAEPTAPSGPAADNTTDSLASTPADAPVTADAGTTTPAAPPAATPAPPTATPPADVHAVGRAAYAQTCIACHGPTGAGTTNGVALTAGLDAAAVKEKVLKGKINPNDVMPAMGVMYSEAQLNALAAFVADGLPQ